MSYLNINNLSDCISNICTEITNRFDVKGDLIKGNIKYSVIENVSIFEYLYCLNMLNSINLKCLFNVLIVTDNSFDYDYFRNEFKNNVSSILNNINGSNHKSVSRIVYKSLKLDLNIDIVSNVDSVNFKDYDSVLLVDPDLEKPLVNRLIEFLTHSKYNKVYLINPSSNYKDINLDYSEVSLKQSSVDIPDSNIDQVNFLNNIEGMFSKLFDKELRPKNLIHTKIFYTDSETRYLFYNMFILREIFKQNSDFQILIQTFYLQDKIDLIVSCKNFMNDFFTEVWCDSDNITVLFNSIKVKIKFVTTKDFIDSLKDTKLIIDEAISRNLSKHTDFDSNTLYVRQHDINLISGSDCIIYSPSKYYDFYKDKILDYFLNGNLLSDNELLEKYKTLGSIEQIVENNNRLMQKVQAYESLGDPSKILKGLELQVQAQLDELKLYKSLGTVQELENYKCKYLKLYSTLYPDIVDNYKNNKFIHEIDPMDLRLD